MTMSHRHAELAAAFNAGVKLSDRVPQGRGGNLAADLRANFPLWRFRTVFDVGANVGQTADGFSEDFRDADTYCFEPGQKAYEELRLNIERGAWHNVQAYRCAFGAQEGEAELYVPSDTALASTVVREGAVERCPMITVDRFCAGKDIERIDVLKIDAEGAELRVLAGAARMLSTGAILAVLVETTLDAVRSNSRFIPIIDFITVLPEHELFGFYDQRPCLSGRQSLGYLNAAFVHKSLLRG